MGLACRGSKAEGTERKMKPARRDGGCRLAGVGASTPGYVGSCTARAAGRRPRAGGSAAAGRGVWGEGSLTRPGAHLVADLEAAAAAYQTFLGPPSHAPPWGRGAGGRGAPRTGRTCGTRGPGCLRSLSPGEARLFRGWDSCGRRDASALQSHKYCGRAGGRRRACGLLAPSRVSWAQGGRPPPQLPASGPGRSWGAGDLPGAGREGLRRRGVGIQVEMGWGRGLGSQSQDEVLEGGW